jgi:(R,R)-butanediol dehydrogenase/meso-butanediol dehydrogenase/diacetyl reductase
MLALRYHGRNDLRLEDIPEPGADPGSVKVRVDWCGICGSDLHEYVAGPITLGTPERPHALTGNHIPLTLGHEFAGTIAEIGDGVDGLSVGQPVAVEPLLYCEKCPACRSGAYNLCEMICAIGLGGDGGAYAQYVAVPAYGIHPLPDGVTTAAGACAEPIVVGWHAVTKSEIEQGQSALVLGAGPIGTGTLIALKARGHGPVLVADPVGGRRTAIAGEFGADGVISTAERATEQVLDATNGAGVDVVFDAAGTQSALDLAMAVVNKAGTIVELALWEQPAALNFVDLLVRETKVVGSIAYAHEYPAVLEAIGDGLIDRPERMVTREVPLADAITGGFDELVANRAGHVKILIQP